MLVLRSRCVSIIFRILGKRRERERKRKREMFNSVEMDSLYWLRV